MRKKKLMALAREFACEVYDKKTSDREVGFLMSLTGIEQALVLEEYREKLAKFKEIAEQGVIGKEAIYRGKSIKELRKLCLPVYLESRCKVKIKSLAFKINDGYLTINSNDTLGRFEHIAKPEDIVKIQVWIATQEKFSWMTYGVEFGDLDMT